MNITHTSTSTSSRCYLRALGNADLNVSDARGDPCLFYTLSLIALGNSGAPAAASAGAAATASIGTKRRHKRSTVTSLDSLPPTFEALHQVLLRGFELAPDRPAAAASSSQPMDIDVDLTAGSSDASGTSGSSDKSRRGSAAAAAAASAASTSSGAGTGAAAGSSGGMLSGLFSRIAGAISSSITDSRSSSRTIGGAKNWGLCEPVPLAVLLAAYLIQHGADPNLLNRSRVRILLVVCHMRMNSLNI